MCKSGRQTRSLLFSRLFQDRPTTSGSSSFLYWGIVGGSGRYRVEPGQIGMQFQIQLASAECRPSCCTAGALGDKGFYLVQIPNGDAIAQLERSRELTIAHPAPDGVGRYRQLAGFALGARQVGKPDNSLRHDVPLVNTP